MRRRHPAAADPRLRHPGRAARRARQARRGSSRRPRAQSTCRSTAASSAWWTATYSTNGCACAPPRTGAVAARRHVRARRARRATASPSCTISEAARGRARPRVRARTVIGADGAMSAVARQCVPGADRMPLRVRLSRNHPRAASGEAAAFDGTRCDVYYQGGSRPISTLDVPARRDGQRRHRHRAQGLFAARRGGRAAATRPGSDGAETIRREGAPIPAEAAAALGQRPRRGACRRCGGRGRAGVRRGHLLRDARRPARGRSGRRSFCATGDARALRSARKRFMKAHGRVFLGARA